MNINELHKQGESQQLEFKESFGKEVAETVAAFSNASGGHILIGINKTGQVKGVTIKVFDHNIRFINPGSLMGGINPEDLMSGNYLAMHRNKLLAEAFYLRGDIEKFGTGFYRMQSELSSWPDVQLSVETANKFTTSRLSTGVPYIPENTIEESTVKTIKQPVIYNKGRSGGRKLNDRLGDKLGDRLGDRLGDKLILLTDNQRIILNLIKNYPTISLSQLGEKIGLSQTAIEKNISKLKKLGYVRRVGPAKGGYWEVIRI